MADIYAYELSAQYSEPEVVTFYFPPDSDSIDDIRKAAQEAANNLEVPVLIYVMPTEGDEQWIEDEWIEPIIQKETA